RLRGLPHARAEALLRRVRQRPRLQGRLSRLGEARTPDHEGRQALREKLLSPWVTVRVQFVLAALFVVAGVLKIGDPPGFAHELHNYRLVPGAAVNAIALVLPWLEVVTGVAL